MAPQNKVKTKQLILETAQKQFAQYGFSKVTMDEIADDIGLGKASLYYYFPTKENLFQAVILQERQGFVKGVSAMVDEKLSAGEKLRVYVRQRFTYFNKLVNLNILDFRASTKAKPSVAIMFEEFAQEELKFLRQIILKGMKSGEFRAGSAEQTAEVFLHIMRGLRLCKIKNARGSRIDEAQLAELKEELDFTTDIFLRGIGRSNYSSSRN